jgi:rhodanese-related sulfurtransferase
MKAHRLIRIAIVFLVIMLLKIITDQMLNYGIKNKGKNALLHVLLSHDIPKISVEDAAMQLDKAIFLDSRSREEYAVSHIQGARYVGYKDFELSKIEGINKEQKIIVYCAIGKRSDTISERLIKAGYVNVQNLYGGIFEWVNEGNSVVDEQNKPTDEIHGYNRLIGWWLERGNKVY